MKCVYCGNPTSKAADRCPNCKQQTPSGLQCFKCEKFFPAESVKNLGPPYRAADDLVFCNNCYESNRARSSVPSTVSIDCQACGQVLRNGLSDNGKQFKWTCPKCGDPNSQHPARETTTCFECGLPIYKKYQGFVRCTGRCAHESKYQCPYTRHDTCPPTSKAHSRYPHVGCLGCFGFGCFGVIVLLTTLSTSMYLIALAFFTVRQ